MSGSNSSPTTWWGTHSISSGGSASWQIGPLLLWIYRTEHEWRIARKREDDPLKDDFAMEIPSSRTESDDAMISRYVDQTVGEPLTLLPALADRPVVASPENLLYIPANEEAILYVSSPLWFQCRIRAASVLLEEEAVFRPSDTWFGSTTLAGELCYASRTTARLMMSDLPIRPHRAISAVKIQNNSSTELLIDRLKLPVPHLSLFASSDGHLWTEALTLERDKDGAQASVRLEKTPPAEVGATELVAKPRLREERGFRLEAFTGFLSKKR